MIDNGTLVIMVIIFTAEHEHKASRVITANNISYDDAVLLLEDFKKNNVVLAGNKMIEATWQSHKLWLAA